MYESLSEVLNNAFIYLSFPNLSSMFLAMRIVVCGIIQPSLKLDLDLYSNILQFIATLQIFSILYLYICFVYSGPNACQSFVYVYAKNSDPSYEPYPYDLPNTWQEYDPAIGEFQNNANLTVTCSGGGLKVFFKFYLFSSKIILSIILRLEI